MYDARTVGEPFIHVQDLALGRVDLGGRLEVNKLVKTFDKDQNNAIDLDELQAPPGPIIAKRGTRNVLFEEIPFPKPLDDFVKEPNWMQNQILFWCCLPALPGNPGSYSQGAGETGGYPVGNA